MWPPAALAALVVGAAGMAGAPARAQLPTLPPTSTTAAPTTTTTRPPTTTTAPDPGPSPTTTPPPAGPEPTDPPAADPGAPGADPGGPGDAGPAVPPAGTPPGQSPAAAPPGGATPPSSVPPVLAPGEVPADARRVINAVRRSRPNSTKRLLAALAPLEQLGMTRAEAIAGGFGRFPVAGPATFTHDWLFPRYTPTFHLHQGTDIFATTGTPVRSPADGTLKLAQGGSGGLAAYVYQADGTYYYMAHLSAFAGQSIGQAVELGEVVGYVGDTGNAQGGSPHLHFEIHPAPTRAVASGKGKSRTVSYVARPVPVGTVLPAADPKATLDQWLSDALANVPQLVAALESRPRALVATGITRRLADGRSAAFPAPVAPPPSQLLWASSVNPAGGALRLAEAEAMVAATEFDWSAASRRQQALLQEQAEAEALTAAILGPLTPESLLPPPSDDA